MINRQEVLRLAGIHGLRPQIVEKDYVIGWVLAGIYGHEALRNNWVFKGGTCLKKCYFETYRFSEDLDFTLVGSIQADHDFLVRVFGEIGDWIYEKTGIEVPRRLLVFDTFLNPRGSKSCQGKLGYRGPIGPSLGYRSLPRIKLDLTLDELVVLPPEEQSVQHEYSDEPKGGFSALCYAPEEAFAEKIRALSQRARPRDLYDVINLFRFCEARPDPAVIRDLLRKKCGHHGVLVPALGALRARRTDFESPWTQMLGHQLRELPPFESYFHTLPEFFDWLEAAGVPPMPPTYQTAVGDTVLRERTMRLPLTRTVQKYLEEIRFAAANHLCVDLQYLGSTRRIEPYSLRRTTDGKTMLHAIRVSDRGRRSYRVDQIQGAAATQQSFVPRFLVELRPRSPTSLGMRVV